ncbi:MAG: mannitol dehydrogenase family protein [Geminicoccaceae bacterium]
MIPLSNRTLHHLPASVAVPAYDRSTLRGGIVHFGVGNFHRVHLALYVDDALNRSFDPAWGIVGVGPTDGPAARAKAEAYAAQDGLYTVTECDPDGTATVRVIGAMIDYLHAPAEPEAVLARLAHPDCRIVSLTITEGGYNLDESDGSFRLGDPDVAHDLEGGPPRTVFGLVVEALARRRAAGLPAFTIASCDNLRGNGDTSRKAFVGFAKARDPGLAAWIEAEVDFPNSMVDRIAPQVDEATRRALNEASGVDDRLPAKAERYNDWVSEDRFRYGRPDLAAVGVRFTDDVPSYLAMKGRMINASHMLLAYPGVLLGYRLVHEAMRDPRLDRLVATFLDRDVIPYVSPPPGVEVAPYKKMIAERFGNPAIGDQILRVAGDGAAKLPIFHGKTLATLLAEGADMKREAFLLACFARYLKARDDTSVRDDRGNAFTVFEPGLDDADWAKVASPDPVEVLRTRPFAPIGLAYDPAFVAAYRRYASGLVERGAAATLAEVLN